MLLFALQSQCYRLLFGASIASMRLVLLFPMGITHRVFSSLCLCLANVLCFPYQTIVLLLMIFISGKVVYCYNILFLPIFTN